MTTAPFRSMIYHLVRSLEGSLFHRTPGMLLQQVSKLEMKVAMPLPNEFSKPKVLKKMQNPAAHCSQAVKPPSGGGGGPVGTGFGSSGATDSTSRGSRLESWLVCEDMAGKKRDGE